jgi:hypothetical protein
MHSVLVHPVESKGPPAPLLTACAATCPPVAGAVEYALPKVRLFPLESVIG